jgi:hypothetical protein
VIQSFSHDDPAYRLVTGGITLNFDEAWYPALASMAATREAPRLIELTALAMSP